MDRATVIDQEKHSTRLEVEEKLVSYKFSLETSNRSGKTISWYMDILRDFFSKYEKIHEQLKPIHEFNRGDLRTYIRHLQNSTKWPNRQQAGKDYGKLSPYTIQGKVRAIKAFWGWLLKEDYITDNPYAGFTLPKVPQNLVKTITPEQFNRYISFIDRNTPEGFMYYLLLLLIFGHGFRISEVLNIKINDIDMLHHFVRIMGKGLFERSVPIVPIAKRQIEKYIKIFRLKITLDGSPYLFSDRDGKPMTVNRIQQYMRRKAIQAGFTDIKITPHILRHSFATEYLRNGGEMYRLKEILGHKHISTTQKYLHLERQDLQKGILEFSPLVQMRLKS